MAEEMPPAWMWPFRDELDDWFAQVDADRRERFGQPARDEPATMTRNEAAQPPGRR